MVKRKRPILHSTPVPGDLYQWDGGDGSRRFVIVSVDAKAREIWMCQALDINSGTETEIGIRKRDPYNGWNKVC